MKIIKKRPSLRVNPVAIAVFAAVLSLQAQAADEQGDLGVTVECNGREMGDEILDVRNLQHVAVPVEILRKCGFKDGLSHVAGSLENGVFKVAEKAEYLSRRALATSGAAGTPYTEGQPGLVANWRVNATPTGQFFSGGLAYERSRLTFTHNNEGFLIGDAYMGVGAQKLGQYTVAGIGKVLGISSGYETATSYRSVLFAQSVDIASYGRDIRILDASGRTIDTIKSSAPGLYDIADIAGRYQGAGRVVVDGRSYEINAQRRLDVSGGLKYFVGAIQRYDDKTQGIKLSPNATISYPFALGASLGVQVTGSTEGGGLELQYKPSDSLQVYSQAFRDRDGIRGNAGVSLMTSLGSFSSYVTSSEHRETTVSATWTAQVNERLSLSATASISSNGNRMASVGGSVGLGWLDSRVNVTMTERANAVAGSSKMVMATLNIPLGRHLGQGSAASNIFQNLQVGRGEMRVSGQTSPEQGDARYDLQLAQAGSGRAQGAFLNGAWTAANTDFELRSDLMKAGETYQVSAAGSIVISKDGVGFSRSQNRMAYVEITAPAHTKVLVDRVVQGNTGRNGHTIVQIPADREVSLTLDDGDSDLAVVEPERQLRVRAGETVKLTFAAETMQ